MCLCGPGVQQRAKGWVYRLRFHQNGKDQGECMGKWLFKFIFQDGRRSFVKLLNYELSPQKSTRAYNSFCFYFVFLSHYGLLQDTEYSPLCYTVGPCCLSVLYIVVCIC